MVETVTAYTVFNWLKNMLEFSSIIVNIVGCQKEVLTVSHDGKKMDSYKMLTIEAP